MIETLQQPNAALADTSSCVRGPSKYGPAPFFLVNRCCMRGSADVGVDAVCGERIED